MTETGTATQTHKISWFVYAGTEKIRKTARMRGTWGYDVECSCGQETRTGGATRSHVEQLVWDHKNGYDIGGWYPVS